MASFLAEAVTALPGAESLAPILLAGLIACDPLTRDFLA